jgi:general secretion pathway protein B
MSYILDSLKKSDQERKRGSVPGVLSDHGGSGPEPGPPQRRRWLYPLGGGFLLLGGIALAVWFQSWQSTEPVTGMPAAAAREETVQVAAVEPERGGRAEQGSSAAGAMARPAAAEVQRPPVPPPAAARAGEDVPRERPGGSEPKPGATRRGPAAVSGEGQSAPPAGPFREAAPDKPLSAPEEAPTEAMPEAGNNGRADLPEVPPARSTAGQQEAPPALDRLPPSVRNGLPEIQISAHFYSKKPAARLVSVNGRILREGQEMNGLKVEEITQNGVIFLHGGRKFFVDVF